MRKVDVKERNIPGGRKSQKGGSVAAVLEESEGPVWPGRVREDHRGSSARGKRDHISLGPGGPYEDFGFYSD